jgi:hypothetical protein
MRQISGAAMFVHVRASLGLDALEIASAGRIASHDWLRLFPTPV